MSVPGWDEALGSPGVQAGPWWERGLGGLSGSWGDPSPNALGLGVEGPGAGNSLPVRGQLLAQVWEKTFPSRCPQLPGYRGLRWAGGSPELPLVMGGQEPEEEQPQASVQAGADLLESSSAERDWECWGTTG